MKDRFFGLDRESRHDENTELVTTTYNSGELAVIKSILEGEGIPYQVKERGSGEAVRVITGFNIYGTDIFVAKEQAQNAREILEAYRNAEPVEEDGENAEEDEEP